MYKSIIGIVIGFIALFLYSLFYKKAYNKLITYSASQQMMLSFFVSIYDKLYKDFKELLFEQYKIEENISAQDMAMIIFNNLASDELIGWDMEIRSNYELANG